MAIIIGLIFFLAVGYFAYTFGQCVAKFSRLDKLINKKVSGTFNLGSRQGISKAKLLMKIGKNLKLNMKNCKISKMRNLKKNANRPKNMVMNCKKFEKFFKIKLPSLQDQIIRISRSYEGEFR